MVGGSPPAATGEVWLVQLDPTVGSEIRKVQKTRPCVVISPPEMNQHLRTVVVAPMTTGSRPAAFRVPVTFKGKTGLILLDQIRTLDKVRLIRREGAVTATTLKRTLGVLQAMFAPADQDSTRLGLPPSRHARQLPRPGADALGGPAQQVEPHLAHL